MHKVIIYIDIDTIIIVIYISLYNHTHTLYAVVSSAPPSASPSSINGLAISANPSFGATTATVGPRHTTRPNVRVFSVVDSLFVGSSKV